VERVAFVFVVPDVPVAAAVSSSRFVVAETAYPFPARKSTSFPSAKNGMRTPLVGISIIRVSKRVTFARQLERWTYALESNEFISMLLRSLVFHSPTCRSDILLNYR
jgi:hypothetical protein